MQSGLAFEALPDCELGAQKRSNGTERCAVYVAALDVCQVLGARRRPRRLRRRGPFRRLSRGPEVQGDMSTLVQASALTLMVIGFPCRGSTMERSGMGCSS